MQNQSPIQKEIKDLVNEIYDKEIVIVSKLRITRMAQAYIKMKTREECLTMVNQGKINIAQAITATEQSLLDHRDYLKQFKKMLYDSYFVKFSEYPESSTHLIMTI